MKKPAIAWNETLRLETLASLNILDTPPEERFDRITRIAMHIFKVPIALVSLVDAHRQWFKSCHGMGATETSRDISFCGHTILHKDIFIIPDALKDPRFADNPLVTGAPHIRFYAGQPLKTINGSRLGALCIIDHKPRKLSKSDLKCLCDMGALVENELNSLEIMAANLTIRDNENSLHAILTDLQNGAFTFDMQGIIKSFNKSAEKIFGYAASEIIGQNINKIIDDHDNKLLGKRKDGLTFPLDMTVSNVKLGGERMFTGIVRGITEHVKPARRRK